MFVVLAVNILESISADLTLLLSFAAGAGLLVEAVCGLRVPTQSLRNKALRCVIMSN